MRRVHAACRVARRRATSPVVQRSGRPPEIARPRARRSPRRALRRRRPSTLTIRDGRSASSPTVRRADRGLPRPRVVLGRALEHPGRPEPRDAGPRQERVRGVVPLAEGEHDEPVGPGAERVRVLEREVDEAVAGADRERLLRIAVPLHARRPSPRGRRRSPPPSPRGGAASPTCRGRSGCAARRARRERSPVSDCHVGRDVPPLAPVELDLVPVRDHALDHVTRQRLPGVARDGRRRRHHLLPPRSPRLGLAEEGAQLRRAARPGPRSPVACDSIRSKPLENSACLLHDSTVARSTCHERVTASCRLCDVMRWDAATGASTSVPVRRGRARFRSMPPKM